MYDLKPRHSARSCPVWFALCLLCLVLSLAACVSPVGRWVGLYVGRVVDKQIAVWDAQQESFASTLRPEAGR